MDLSLPEKAPEIEAFFSLPMNLLPFALYVLVELDERESEEVLRVCNENSGNPDEDVVRFPPQSRFIGGPLRAVFDHHIQLADQHTFDPMYFVAVTSLDWRENGVLIVALDDGNLECTVDKSQFRADDSGLLLVNMQIGNMGWYENKENCAISQDSSIESHGSVPSGGNDGGDQNNGVPRASEGGSV